MGTEPIARNMRLNGKADSKASLREPVSIHPDLSASNRR